MSAKFYLGVDERERWTDQTEADGLRAFLELWGVQTFDTAEAAIAPDDELAGGIALRITVEVDPADER